MPHQDERWAIFWCSLLGPIFLEHVPIGERRQYLNDVSQKELLLPDSRRKRISLSTLRRKVRQFRQQGIAGLFRQPRSDRGRARKDRQAMIARAIELKRDQPTRSAVEINHVLREEFHATVPKSTLYQHLKHAGATRRTRVPSPTKLESRIRSIPAADTEQLQQWRHSNNKWLWDRAVTILDSCDSTLEEICSKTERSPSSIRRWIRLYNTRGIDGLKRKSRDWERSV